jgi:hypothetical protein
LLNSPIQVGSINLQDFEIPQSVRFGGRQRLAIHALAGGRRIVERLGPDDDDIQFQGIFSGPTAQARVVAFDNLRMSGEIVWLTWESFRRRVIIRSLTADYHSPWWIPYQIKCTVADQRQIAAPQQASLAAVLSADIGAALLYAVGAGTSLMTLQVAMSAANALIAGSADQSIAIARTDSVMQSVNGQVDQLSSVLVRSSPSNASASGLSDSYVSKVGAAGSLAAAVNVRSYVGRIGMNIAGSNV